MSHRGIPLDKAAVFSVVLEGILYGFSVFMFIGTMWALYRERSTKEVNKNMVVIACILLLLSTAHIMVDIIRNEEGLILTRDTYPGGPSVWFSDVSRVTFNIKNGIYTVQTIVGDAVVIYRCYVVWRSFWIIVIPLFGLCGVAIGGFGTVWSCSVATTQATNIFFPSTGQWVTAFYASTFSTNLLATGLLAYRIWSIDRSVSGIRKTKSALMPFLLITIDTGLLYSVTLMGALICFVRESNGQYVVLDMVTPIISIAFYMIIIRLAIQRNTSSREGMNSSVGLNTLGQSAGHRSQGSGRKPLEVHITQFTENEGEIENLSRTGSLKGREEV